jgi:ABC-type uncharacterized transport system ATPase subunit
VKSCSIQHNPEESNMNLILENDSILSEVITTANQLNLKLNRLEKREPSLEDVFIKLVGQPID